MRIWFKETIVSTEVVSKENIKFKIENSELVNDD